METNKDAELFGALAKAQGEFPAIEKNRDVVITLLKGGKYNFRYADLDEILTKTRPSLSKNGLALVQRMEFTDGVQMMVCSLLHSGGGVLSSSIAIPSARDLADPKSFGAAMTYFRRYLVTSLIGVAADDDLDEDGQEASNKKKPDEFQARAKNIKDGVKRGDAEGAAAAMAGWDKPLLDAVWGWLDEETQNAITAAWPK